MEQSGSGTGNAFAGAAVAAEDASTLFYNPAGMSLLPPGHHLSLAGFYVQPSSRFRNDGSIGATLFGAPSANTVNADAGEPALIPSGYVAMELGKNTRFGFGINVPFGLATEYPGDWIGRFQGVRSELLTLNLNPALSWQPNSAITVGVGLNYQTIDAELTSQTNYAAAVFAATGSALAAATIAAAGQAEGRTTLKGNDTGWGWNAGIVLSPGSRTRVGVAYRSRIRYSVEGTVRFENRPGALAGALPDGNIKIDVSMPDTLSIALSHALNERVKLLADLTWTGWKVLDKLEVVRTGTIPASGATLQSIPYNWRNTWRAGVGANVSMNERWMLKGGLAYDQTPTVDSDRSVRLPDGDRLWFALGAKYTLSPVATLDVGYAHIFVKSPSINNNAGGANQNSTAAYGLVKGRYDNAIDMLSVQYSHRF